MSSNKIILTGNIFECEDYIKNTLIPNKISFEGVLGCGTFSSRQNPTHSLGLQMQSVPSFFSTVINEKIISGHVHIFEKEPIFLKHPIAEVSKNIPIYNWLLLGLHPALFAHPKIESKKFLSSKSCLHIHSVSDWCHLFLLNLFKIIDTFPLTHVFLFLSFEIISKYIYSFMNWLAYEKNNDYLIQNDISYIYECISKELAYFLATQHISQEIILVLSCENEFRLMIDGIKHLKTKKLSMDRSHFII